MYTIYTINAPLDEIYVLMIMNKMNYAVKGFYKKKKKKKKRDAENKLLKVI
jgi:hypothetical protein